MNFLLLLALAGTTAVPATEVANPNHCVLILEKEPPRPATAEEMASGSPPGNMVAAWIWTSDAPPTRRSKSQWGLPLHSPCSGSTLVVGLHSVPNGVDVEVVAGPTRMWREAPESLMPHWATHGDGRLSVTRDGESDWRVRAVGNGMGST